MNPEDTDPRTVGSIWLKTETLEFINAEIVSKLPNETGGVLLGYWINPPQVISGAFQERKINDLEVLVTHAVGPGPQAKHGYTYFVPDHDYHVQQVASIYELTGRTSVYLGDWHCHPKGEAGLSSIDLSTMSLIARAPQGRCPYPVMMIMRELNLERSKCWCLVRQSNIRTLWLNKSTIVELAIRVL